MRPTNDQRIVALRSRRAQIDEELARLEAKAKKEERKNDTRRKILIGAVILQEMGDKPEFDALVHTLLKQRLTRPNDRALFGLQTIGGVGQP